MNTSRKETSSFRDPGGFLFWRNDTLYRQINLTYKEHYERLMDSGLFENLIKSGWIIYHREVSIEPVQPQIAFKVILPERIDFVSYPYEWCFSQLKDAALTTLRIQKMALDFGMSLKDASAYNIQFFQGKPVLIDTLSFEIYREGQPWAAYRQFCQHFLAPLALMSYKDIRLNQLLRIYIDGVPLDLATSLCPFHSRFNLSLLSHLHLHSRSQKRYETKNVNVQKLKLSRLGLLGLIDNLESTIRRLTWQPRGTEWADYYRESNYSDEALDHKKRVVAGFIDQIQPLNIWDLGANTGIFTRLAAQKGIPALSLDNDPAAIEKNYLACCKNKETRILPLVIDLTNPSPGLGWQNQERQSLIERGPADMVLALALIHHLAISNNVPLGILARFFQNLCNTLVIEFVPETDSQMQRLLAARKDFFPDYSQAAFESEFKQFFSIRNSVAIPGSDRILYLMQKIVI